MNAAPKIATPELSAIQCGGGCPPEKWITIHCKQSNADEPIQSQFAIRSSERQSLIDKDFRPYFHSRLWKSMPHANLD